MKGINFEKDVPGGVYYMKQTISNACGTVAMIHSVANSLDSISLENGILKDFLEATKESSPEERAKQLEENDNVCEVHDNIAREGQTAVSSKKLTKIHFLVKRPVPRSIFGQFSVNFRSILGQF